MPYMRAKPKAAAIKPIKPKAKPTLKEKVKTGVKKVGTKMKTAAAAHTPVTNKNYAGGRTRKR